MTTGGLPMEVHEEVHEEGQEALTRFQELSADLAEAERGLRAMRGLRQGVLGAKEEFESALSMASVTDERSIKRLEKAAWSYRETAAQYDHPAKGQASTAASRSVAAGLRTFLRTASRPGRRA